MHLLTPELQRKALLNIRDHLTEDGILTLNTFAPYPPFQAQQMKTSENDYTYRLEYINHEGNREKIYNAISYDPLTQIMSGNWKFETYDDAGNKKHPCLRPTPAYCAYFSLRSASLTRDESIFILLHIHHRHYLLMNLDSL